MHELGITRNIVSIVTENADGARVKRISLEIGRLSGVMAEAVRFCFDICSKDTPLEGCQLEITEPPGFAHCGICNSEQEMAQLFGQCVRCGSRDLTFIAGQELKIKEMEVFESCA